MTHWFYVEDRTRRGPVDRDTLVKLITMGKLPADTLVWTEQLGDWTPASSVKGLVQVAISARVMPPPVPPPAPPEDRSITASQSTRQALVPDRPPTTRFVAAGPQVRPWIRFWARTTDYGLFGMVLTVILLLFAPDATQEMLDSRPAAMAFGIVVVFLWVFVEAASLAVLGTTPAKALLNIQVRHPDGRLLSYGEALRRSFSVWFSGVGMGLPLVQVFFMAFSYFKLKESGTTNWDDRKPWHVQHRPVGWIRAIALVVLLLIWILLNFPFPES